jgi:hypothetical protein
MQITALSCLSFRLSLYTFVAPTKRIFEKKYDIGNFYGSLSRNSGSCQNRTTVSGTSHEDPSALTLLTANTKCSTARQQCSGNTLHFIGDSEHLILLTATYRSTEMRREYTIIFSWQKWLGERATMLRVPTSIIFLCFIFLNFGLAAGILTKTL